MPFPLVRTVLNGLEGISEIQVCHKKSHNSPSEPPDYLILRATATAAALCYVDLCMLRVKTCFCVVKDEFKSGAKMLRWTKCACVCVCVDAAADEAEFSTEILAVLR